MARSKKILAITAMLLIVVMTLYFSAARQAKSLHRDRSVLLNKYYLLKYSHAAAAEQALLILLKQNPNDLPALQELSQLYLDDKKFNQALPLIKRLHNLLPDHVEYSLLLTYLENINQKNSTLETSRLNEINEWKNSHYYIKSLIAQKPLPQFLRSYLTYASLDGTMHQKQAVQTDAKILSNRSGNETTLSKEKPKEENLLSSFFDLKAKSEVAAWRLIQAIIAKQPDNVTALKEGGYLAIKLGYLNEAIVYFKRIEEQTRQPDASMQLGYLYDKSGNKQAAYRQFLNTAMDKNNSYRLQAENALTSLSCVQTKVLPSPYFSDFFFSPFTQSRFGLTVRPLIARVGVEHEKGLAIKEYLVLRQTDDNRSKNLGELPQIYEDNVRIFGAGVQIAPVTASFPLSFYVEAGGAYDLIPQNRDRWRFDLRSNLIYYNEFGTKPRYANNPEWSTNYYSTVYGSIAYFSRYNNNVIGTFTTHQGIRLFQYHSAMVNLYASGRILADTRREFFNNLAEAGPGISFIPSNRFNTQLRFEYLKGMYLPAGGSINPYGKYYNNRILQLLFYVKL